VVALIIVAVFIGIVIDTSVLEAVLVAVAVTPVAPVVDNEPLAAFVTGTVKDTKFSLALLVPNLCWVPLANNLTVIVLPPHPALFVVAT
jgi:hypothetical protein